MTRARAASSLLYRAAFGAGLIEALPLAVIRVVALLASAKPPARRCAGAGGAGGAAARHADGPALLMTWTALWPTLHLPGISLTQRALDAGVRALVLFTGRPGKCGQGAVQAGRRRLAEAAEAPTEATTPPPPGMRAPPAPTAALLSAGVAPGGGFWSPPGPEACAPLGATAGHLLLAMPLLVLPFMPRGWGKASPGACCARRYGAR